MAREVGNPHMGQDQEAGVADDLLEAPGPGGIVPADPLIAPLKTPSGRRELEAAQDCGAFGCGLNQVAEMGAKGYAMAESMMALDQCAPQRPVCGRFHALESDRLQGGQRRVERGRLWVRADRNRRPRPARATGPQRGQADQPRLLQSFKERPAFNHLRLSVGAVPVEELAHRLCQLMAA